MLVPTMNFLRSFGDILGLAAAGCAANPLRSALSGLAVTAAVATIAVVVTGLDGVQRFAEATSAKTFGSDTFVVAQIESGQLNRRELAEQLARNPPIRRNDVRFLDKYAGNRAVYSSVAQRPADVSAGGRKFERASINGVDATMFQIRDLGISEGRFFDRSEAVSGAQVAVLGADVADELFPGRSPLTRSVRIGGRGFRVVGLQARQGTSGGVSLDRYVWIPIVAFERCFGAAESLQVFAKAGPGLSVEGGEAHARTSMRARRQLRPAARDNFAIVSPQAARGFVLALSQRVSAAALPISLMALLASVIVVANTALVSVTQRIQEIGVRRAMGAARGRIQIEVLTESGLIGLVGGAVGLLVAAGVLNLAAGALELELRLAPATVFWSFFAALFSGLLAGWYPARWASRVHVVNALRME